MRSIEDIEKAFRDMGLTEATWGIPNVPPTDTQAAPTAQVFVRTDTTTAPLEKETHAHLAQPSE